MIPVLHPARTARWSVDPERTTATFAVGNLGRRVRGSMPVLSGCVDVVEGRPVGLTADLDLDRIVTGIARRDADLRKKRLLDIDRHPVLTYRAERFEPVSGGWRAAGELGARGTTCPLDVLGVLATAGDDLHVVGTATFDRTAIGLRAPRLLIGREITITVDAWLTAT